ncbi:hypothetical protein BH10PSE7_BH10PSE7_44480 [soil metagenome]
MLIAEDFESARILTAALLRRMGCDVDTAEHGEEALAHVRRVRYDIILLDIEMPVMDGVCAAREIRSLSGEAAKTPLMALSAFLADTRRSDQWQDSFDLALAKPAGRSELQQAIQSLLDRDARPI